MSTSNLIEIQQLLARYCYAHDSRDLDMLGSCFARDVELVGEKGRDAVVQRFADGYKKLTLQRRHVLTNFLLLEDGDTEALVQTYITLYIIRGDSVELHLTGIYRDRVIVEDGAWKLRRRDSVMDVPYNPGDTAPAAAGAYAAGSKPG
jgi:hypothetical protein